MASVEPAPTAAADRQLVTAALQDAVKVRGVEVLGEGVICGDARCRQSLLLEVTPAPCRFPDLQELMLHAVLCRVTLWCCSRRVTACMACCWLLGVWWLLSGVQRHLASTCLTCCCS